MNEDKAGRAYDDRVQFAPLGATRFVCGMPDDAIVLEQEAKDERDFPP
jgi:hypothetical protein